MSKAKVEIIYQDDDIIVINKPSGVSVTKDRGGAPQLLDLFGKQLGPQICSRLLLVHRLDKDTSGVMLLAKNTPAQTLFSGFFSERLVKKTYLAIVTGAIPGPSGTIDAPLAPNPKNAAVMCIAARKGREAITEWKLLADFGLVALLAVNPLTGRTHQIRVHLSSIGLPLAIDPLYSSSQPLLLSDTKADYRLRKGQTEKPLIERLTLHAYQLVIPAEPVLSRVEGAGIHPDCFIAGLDKKFAATIKMLTKHNPKGPAAFLDPDDFEKIISGQKL